VLFRSREPDAQLGFLWGGMTMGMLLSIPLILFGVALIADALRRPPLNANPQRPVAAGGGLR